MNKAPGASTTPPTRQELSARLTRARELMAKQQLDYYVSFDPVNIYYLTNFANIVHERPFILVIPKAGPLSMLAPLLEVSHVKAQARCELKYVTYPEFPAPEGENWYNYYTSIIESNSRVGIESCAPVAIYEKTPANKIVIDIIDEVRIEKSDYEIARSVHACEIAKLGHAKLLEVCRPGVTEARLSQEVTQAMRAKMLADIPAPNSNVTNIWASVWPPSLSHDPHNRPSQTTVMQEGGPHVSIVIAQVDGYGVELERTFFLGSVPEKAKAPFEAMFQARELAYKLTKPGANMSAIDVAVRESIIQSGYGDFVLHRTGHGLGITGHEAPYLARGYDRQLASNMLISIEPGIYIPGIGGFRHSDSVLITDHGCINLTPAPDKIDELTIPL